MLRPYTIFRSLLAILLGNAFGYGLFRLAGWASSLAWQGGPPATFGELLWRIGLTAVAFGAPPVLMGALAARLASRFEPGVGLAAALWGVTARQWWPSTVPLLPAESWIAPMTLILLSGLLGGWLAGLRAVAPIHLGDSHISKDSSQHPRL
jgi:hypothetical protein